MIKTSSTLPKSLHLYSVFPKVFGQLPFHPHSMTSCFNIMHCSINILKWSRHRFRMVFIFGRTLKGAFMWSDTGLAHSLCSINPEGNLSG